MSMKRTLVRTRGRPGNEKRKIHELEKSRKKSRKAWSKREEEEATRISYLENLPVELLQRLFVESGNTELALVSKRLHIQLLSNLTLIQLVIKCYTGIDDRVMGAFDQWTNEDHAAVARLRSLISQNWFTYPLFEAARQTWLVDKAVEVVEDLLGDSKEPLEKEEQDKIRPRLQSLLEFSLMEANQCMDERAKRIMKDLLWDHPDGEEAPDFRPDRDLWPKEGSDRICCFQHDSLTVLVKFGCTPNDRPLRFDSDFNNFSIWTTGKHEYYGLFRFRKPVYEQAHIPSSFFNRKLTQSTGDLFFSLLAPSEMMNPYPYPTRKLNERLVAPWNKMLTHALKDRCRIAILHLWEQKEDMMGSESLVPNVKEKHLPHDSDIRVRPLAVLQDTAHHYYQLPWTFVNFSMDISLSNCPAPTEENWACCIDFYFEEPELYLKLMWDEIAPGDADLPVLSDRTLNKLYVLKEHRLHSADEKKMLGKIYKSIVDAAVHG